MQIEAIFIAKTRKISKYQLDEMTYPVSSMDVFGLISHIIREYCILPSILDWLMAVNTQRVQLPRLALLQSCVSMKSCPGPDSGIQ